MADQLKADERREAVKSVEQCSYIQGATGKEILTEKQPQTSVEYELLESSRFDWEPKVLNLMFI